MTIILAVWTVLMLVAAVVSIGIARRWTAGEESPRDAAITLLVIWLLVLAAVAVIALQEVQP